MSGSGGSGGYEYQHNAIGYVAAHILAGEPLGWRLETGAPDIPVAVAAETGGPGDDLCIALQNGVIVELQAKHGLRKGKLFEPLLKLAQGLYENPSLYGVLLTDSTASQTIQNDLRKDLERIGQGRFDSLKSITREFQDKLVSANLPDDNSDIFRRLRIIVRDLEDDQQGARIAQSFLSKLISNQDQASVVWKILCDEGQILTSNRGRRDQEAWYSLLNSHSIFISDRLRPNLNQIEGSRTTERFEEYLDSVCEKYQNYWRPYAFIDEIDDSTWFEFGLDTKVETQHQRENESQQDGESQQTKRQPILQAIQEFGDKSLLIFGSSGSGKSTLLSKLFYASVLKARKGESNLIPVLIELKSYETAGENSKTEGLILSFLQSHNPDLDKEDLKQIRKEKRLALFIDGFNELPNERAKPEITQYCKNVRTIATSRNEGDWGELGQRLEIQPLTYDEVIGFFKEHLPGTSQEKLKELGNRVKDFGDTPLIVWMLYCIFNTNKEIPETRGEAYRRFTTLYLERSKEGIDLPESRTLLSKLAFEMMRSSNTENLTDFRLELSEIDAQNILDSEQALKLLRNCHLLKFYGKPGNRRIKFCHQSLQEYYAAEELLLRFQKKHPDWTDALRFQYFYLNQRKWTESIALMLSMHDDETLATQIINRTLKVDLLLSARLFKTMKIQPQEDITGVILNYLAHIVPEKPTWFQLKLLKEMGSRAKTQYFLPLLNDSDRSVRGLAYIQLLILDRKDEIPEDSQASRDSNRMKKILQTIDDGDIQNSSDSQASFPAEKNPEEGKFSLHPDVIDYLSVDARSVYELWHSAELNEHEVLEKLAPALQTRERQTQMSAVMVIGRIRTFASLELLFSFLESPDCLVRSSVAIEIAESREKSSIKRLINIIRNNSDPEVRRLAVFALPKIDTEDIMPGILMALDDSEPDVILEGIKAIGDIEDIGIARRLLDITFHKNPVLSRTAAHKLRELGGKDAIKKYLTEEGIQDLVKGLLHPVVWVRWKLALILRNVATEEVLPHLITELQEHRDPITDLCIASVLGRFKCWEAIPYLIKMLDSKNLGDFPEHHEVIWSIAAYDLGRARNYTISPENLPALFRLLSSPAGESVLRAIEATQENCGFYNYEIAQLKLEAV